MPSSYDGVRSEGLRGLPAALVMGGAVTVAGSGAVLRLASRLKREGPAIADGPGRWDEEGQWQPDDHVPVLLEDAWGVICVLLAGSSLLIAACALVHRDRGGRRSQVRRPVPPTSSTS